MKHANLLFAVFSIVLTSSSAVAETMKKEFRFSLVCAASDKNCIERQEGELKKLGCEIEQAACELWEGERTFSEDTRMNRRCDYLSPNCKRAEQRSCPPGFNSRWQNENQNSVFCLKSESNSETTTAPARAVQSVKSKSPNKQ